MPRRRSLLVRLAPLLLVAALALLAGRLLKRHLRAAAPPPPPPPEAEAAVDLPPRGPAATPGAHPILPPFRGDLDHPLLLDPGPAEPSGVVYLPEHEGFLVVDDESTLEPQRGIFFLATTPDGGLSPIPVRLDDLGARQTWDDLEAVAASPETLLFLASHAYDSSWRQRICWAPRAGLSRAKEGEALLLEGLQCTSERRSREALLEALEPAVGEEPELDLEGLTFSEAAGAFLVGVRHPLAKERALLLTLQPPRGRSGHLQIQLARTLDLKQRGIRGMSFLDRRRLVLAAGPAGDNPGRFDLYLHDLAEADEAKATTLLTPAGFPLHLGGDPTARKLRIEGLAFDGEALLVLCDSGDWPEEGVSAAPTYTFRLPLQAD
ncbi:MAG: hypothetical protein P1V51_15445 [Deltaproteobacteria bacterium]|nr:hypothetical protein [Deltaproteobacteria bacterium]